MADDVVKDLLPEELKFICRLCHIAANKRMSETVECGDKNVTGQYCEKIERLRRALLLQGAEVEASRKYIGVFKGVLKGKTVFRKQELKKLYDKYSANTPPSFDEFLDFCRMNEIEVLE